jgi:putative DNA primase/helicase
MTHNAQKRNHSNFPAADQLRTASTLLARGLSPIPIRTDGSKAPLIDGWREFSDRLPTAQELRHWFRVPGRAGVGVTGGTASGNLVVFDFERWDVFTRWGGLLTLEEREHLARCPVVATPKGGAHVYCRLLEPVKGARYARDADGVCLIETRGEGHYVLAPGSPACCHPNGHRYRLLRPGWLDCRDVASERSEGGNGEALNREEAEPIPLDVFHSLTTHAAELNEYRRPAPREVFGDRLRSTSAVTAACRRPAVSQEGQRPGDQFNCRAAWADILTPHGWKLFRSTDSAAYWTRPGKSPAGISASTGFCRGPSGSDLLYVFSTSAAPFEPEHSYSRFAAYALLNHRGDFSAASRALGLAGYKSFSQKEGTV